MHYSKEKPSYSTFRVITINFRVSEILGLLRYWVLFFHLTMDFILSQKGQKQLCFEFHQYDTENICKKVVCTWMHDRNSNWCFYLASNSIGVESHLASRFTETDFGFPSRQGSTASRTRGRYISILKPFDLQNKTKNIRPTIKISWFAVYLPTHPWEVFDNIHNFVTYWKVYYHHAYTTGTYICSHVCSFDWDRGIKEKSLGEGLKNFGCALDQWKYEEK